MRGVWLLCCCFGRAIAATFGSDVRESSSCSSSNRSCGKKQDWEQCGRVVWCEEKEQRVRRLGSAPSAKDCGGYTSGRHGQTRMNWKQPGQRARRSSAIGLADRVADRLVGFEASLSRCESQCDGTIIISAPNGGESWHPARASTRFRTSTPLPAWRLASRPRQPSFAAAPPPRALLKRELCSK